MKKPSGIEQVPPVLDSPFYKDPFFWWGIIAALFWIALFYWLFS